MFPFLPEWNCYLCRQQRSEQPLVRGYLGGIRETNKQNSLRVHLTCTLFVPDIQLLFTPTHGFEAFNFARVRTHSYECMYCHDDSNALKGFSVKC